MTTSTKVGYDTSQINKVFSQYVEYQLGCHVDSNVNVKAVLDFVKGPWRRAPMVWRYDVFLQVIPVVAAELKWRHVAHTDSICHPSTAHWMLCYKVAHFLT